MASVGRCRIDAPTPLAITASTDAIASFENRGTDVASTSARRSPAKASSTSSPASPPIQSEPDTRCTQSKVSDSAAGEVCAACPASPGTASMAPPASTAPTIASSAAIDRAPVPRSIRIATAAASPNSAVTISRSTSARPSADERISGTTWVTSNTERSAKLAVVTSM